jgi:hypothetical protein
MALPSTLSSPVAVHAEIDRTSYPPGTKVSNEEMSRLRLEPAAFHGEWNYTIRPRKGL